MLLWVLVFCTQLLTKSKLCPDLSCATTPRCQQEHQGNEWGLSSAMISSLRNSIHPPEMEKHPPKMARGCPHNRLINNSHTCNLLTLWNAFVNVQLHAGWHLQCTDDGHYTNSPKHLSFLYKTVWPKNHRCLKLPCPPWEGLSLHDRDSTAYSQLSCYVTMA